MELLNLKKKQKFQRKEINKHFRFFILLNGENMKILL